MAVTAAQLNAVLATLSPEELVDLKLRLDGDQKVQLTIPALLSQTQLEALVTAIAAAYPPVSTQLLALL